MTTKKTIEPIEEPIDETPTGKFKAMLKKVTGGLGITDPPKPATTTSQEDIVTLRQARINLIWEGGQLTIAIMITASTIYCIINSIEADVLNNAFFLVVSMYYIRTNHTKQGGTGYKDPFKSRSTE